MRGWRKRSAGIATLSAMTKTPQQLRAEILELVGEYHRAACPPQPFDARLATYNVDVEQLEAAVSPRTRALMFAHTLGNPFDLAQLTAFAARHHLWLIEDCCDAVGATYQGKPVGTFGELATCSFYPAH